MDKEAILHRGRVVLALAVLAVLTAALVALPNAASAAPPNPNVPVP